MIDLLIKLLILGVSSASLSVLIVRDSIFSKPRHWFFLQFPPENNIDLDFFYQDLNKDGSIIFSEDKRRKVHFLGKLFSCTRCTSFWTTLLLLLVHVFFDEIGDLFIITLFSWSIASFVSNRL